LFWIAKVGKYFDCAKESLKSLAICVFKKLLSRKIRNFKNRLLLFDNLFIHFLFTTYLWIFLEA
jgi:hypothetical protein